MYVIDPPLIPTAFIIDDDCGGAIVVIDDCCCCCCCTCGATVADGIAIVVDTVDCKVVVVIGAVVVVDDVWCEFSLCNDSKASTKPLA